MQKLIEKFEKFYGKKPTVAAQAPGRLEILGNHTDYNQGFVLSCAVEQNTKFALAPVDGKHCRIKDFRDNSVREFDLGNIATAIPRDWSNYIKGVIVELEKRGIRVGAFDAGMESTVPLSAGYSIVVVNSMAKHNLVDSEYNVRRQDCESAAHKLAGMYPDVRTLRDVSLEQLEVARPVLTEREYRRALHVVGECTRVMEAVRLLEANDVAGFGRLWFESHESSRVNFENSTEELDYLVELAKSVPGGLGARLSGGGFGGITIHLVKSEGAEEYAKRVLAGYKARTGVDAEYIICAIGDGASAQKL